MGLGALSEKLELLINADPSQGVAAMQRFANQTEKSVGEAESSLKRLSSGALKVGGAGIGVGGLLTQMADGDIAAANQLKAAIGQVGQSYDDYAERIDKAAAAQTRFGHTDEEVNGAVTTLTLAYNDTGKALDQLQLVTDLAARKHISLGAAADLVAKAHGGAGRVFKEFGITVGQNVDGTKDYDGALGELSKKLTGQAAAAVDTWGGRLDALKAKAENFFSALGQDYGPAILGVSTGLTALGAVTTGVTSLTERFSRSSAVAGEAVEETAGKTGKLSGAIGKAGLGIAAAAGVAALYEYGQSLNKTSASTEDLEKITKLSAGNAATVFEEITKNSVGPFSGALDDAIAKLAAMGPAGVGTLTEIRDQVKAAGGDTSKYDAAIASAAQSQDNLNSATDAGTQILELSKEAQKNLAAQLDATTKQLDAQRTAQDGLLGSSISAEEANFSYKDSLNKILVAQAAANKATGVDALAAQEDLRKAVLDSASAAEQLAQKTADAQVAQDAANGTTDSAAQKSQIQRDALKHLADQLAPDSPLRQYLDQYIYTLASIPGQKDTVLTIHTDTNLHPTTAQTSPRAVGGPVFAGSSYDVGELGPERVTFGASGFVTSNDKLGKSTGAGPTVHQHFYASTDPEEQQAEASRRLRIEAILTAA